jgi:hypothetical protein
VAGWAGALGAPDAAAAPEPQSLDASVAAAFVAPPHDDPLSFDEPDPHAVPPAAGAEPQPAGSLAAVPAAEAPEAAATASGAVTSAVVVVPAAGDSEAAPVSDDARLRKATTSLPAGMMATTSQPSADFSESFAASEAAS